VTAAAKKQASPKSGRLPPTLWLIIGFKLLKGTLLLSLALGIFSLINDDLPTEFRRAVNALHLDPEQVFFTRIAAWIETVSPEKVGWVATGTLLYSLFSLVEGVGLILRAGWAGWLAIGESAFFIPIEVFDLTRAYHRSIFIVLVMNVLIVLYLLRNRERLFTHH
jgi:uncharacterized membrane protein (DUF2068 family)